MSTPPSLDSHVEGPAQPSRPWAPIVQAASVGVLNRFSALAIRLLTIPIVLRYLGAERYGLWLTLASATAYITLMDFGLSGALVNRLTAYYQREQKRHASILLFSAATLLVPVAVVIMLLAFAMVSHVDIATLLQLETPLAVAEAGPTILVAAAFGCLYLFSSVMVKVPYAMQRGRIAEAYQLASNLMGLLGVLAGVYFDLGLPVMACALMAPSPVAAVLIAIHLAARADLRPVAPGMRRLKAVASMLRRTAPSFAVMQGVAALLAALQFTLIGVYHGAAAVTPYGLMSQILMASITPFTVLQQPLWTRLAELFQRGDTDAIRRVIRQYAGLALAYFPVAVLGIVVLTNPVLSLIMEDPITIGLDLRVSFAILAGQGLVSGGNIGSMLYAMELARPAAVLAVAQLVLFLALANIFTPAHGAMGMAASVVAINALALPVQIRLLRGGLRGARPVS